MCPLLASWLSDAFAALIQFALAACLLLWAGGYFLSKAAPQRVEQARADLGALVRKLFGK